MHSSVPDYKAARSCPTSLIADAYPLYLGHQGGSTGTYTISGGMLHANDFYIGTGGDGTFHITDSAADVYVGNGLHFGANATFTAVAGATINMIGSTLTNESTDPTATGLAGLENVNLIFQGGTDDVDPVEVAGEDKGLVAGGWVENFALDTLTLGAGFEMTEGRIRLVDDFDNQPGWVGSEALYVDTLVLNAGATIDPNNLNLYYLNGGAAKKFYLGDANLDGKVNVGDLGILAANYGQNEKVWAQADFNGDALVNVGDLGILAANYGSGEGGGMVPEPATLVLLVIGALPLTRRRR